MSSVPGFKAADPEKGLKHGAGGREGVDGASLGDLGPIPGQAEISPFLKET